MDTTPCAAIRRLVYEFLDEELPQDDVTRVARHLDLCRACAAFFGFERAFLRVLDRRTLIESCPAELRERLRLALANRERPRPAS